jgi:nicotinamide mononucleotide transporter
MYEITQILIENIKHTTVEEIVAVIFGLLSVWYASKNNILVYPTGIVSVLIYVYICYIYGLYADMGVNAFYFIMSVFGWYNWTHLKTKVDNKSITRTSIIQKFYLATLLIFFFLVLKFILTNYTNSTVPTIDSITTALFLIAMVLMALKKIENWTLWIIGDIISVPLYYSKGLVLTSIQYLIFLIIAIMGYFEWRKLINKV